MLARGLARPKLRQRVRAALKRPGLDPKPVVQLQVVEGRDDAHPLNPHLVEGQFGREAHLRLAAGQRPQLQHPGTGGRLAGGHPVQVSGQAQARQHAQVEQAVVAHHETGVEAGRRGPAAFQSHGQRRGAAHGRQGVELRKIGQVVVHGPLGVGHAHVGTHAHHAHIGGARAVIGRQGRAGASKPRQQPPDLRLHQRGHRVGVVYFQLVGSRGQAAHLNFNFGERQVGHELEGRGPVAVAEDGPDHFGRHHPRFLQLVGRRVGAQRDGAQRVQAKHVVGGGHVTHHHPGAVARRAAGPRQAQPQRSRGQHPNEGVQDGKVGQAGISGQLGELCPRFGPRQVGVNVMVGILIGSRVRRDPRVGSRSQPYQNGHHKPSPKPSH